MPGMTKDISEGDGEWEECVIQKQEDLSSDPSTVLISWARCCADRTRVHRLVEVDCDPQVCWQVRLAKIT